MLCRRCMVVMKTGNRYEQRKGQNEPSHQRYFECRKCYDRVYTNALSFQEVLAGEYKLIPLGVAMELPNCFEAHIYPRSSTYKNFGILQANSVGIIDNSYKGDDDQWMFPAIAVRDTIIHKNNRICQFRIVRNQPEIVFNEAKHLKESNRGGFGSSGVR